MGQQKVMSFDAEKAGLVAGKKKGGEHRADKKDRRPAADRVMETAERRAAKAGKDVRYIVRMMNKDLDGTLPIARAIAGIKGVSIRFAGACTKAFEKTAGISPEKLLGEVPEEQCRTLEDIVLNPIKYGVPSWFCNRQKDRATGENKHSVMSELDFALRQDLQRMGDIKSYRGLRHVWKLPVRGQRTKSTHRGKGGVVGVVKKEEIAKKGARNRRKEKGEMIAYGRP